MRKYGGTWRWGRDEAPWSFAFTENEELHLRRFDYAYQVERSTFDEILLRHAAEIGVDVREEQTVVEGLKVDGRVTGVRYKDSHGYERVVRSRFVVDASGYRSTLFRLAGQRVFSDFFRNVALFCYYEDANRRPAPRQGDILCAAFDLGWFWFIPLSPTLTSVGAVIGLENAALLQRDLEVAMAHFIARCPIISDLLKPSRRITNGSYGKLRTRSDYSYCNTRFFSPGLVLVGDAACFVDPVFSTGVHLATYSGLLAARSINTCLTGQIDEQRCLEEFEHRYRLEFQNIYDFMLVIYDMNHDKESYFWNARKIMNTSEAANQAFVRLVAGMGTTGNDFFEKRRGLGQWGETGLKGHVYADTSTSRKESAISTAPLGPGLRARAQAWVSDVRKKGNVRESDNQSMIFGTPFPRFPIRPTGLIASSDGLSWLDPANTPTKQEASQR